MKISTKLQSGYLLVVLMMLLCSSAGYFGFVQVSKQLDHIATSIKEASHAAAKIKVSITEQMLLVENALTKQASHSEHIDAQEAVIYSAVQQIENSQILSSKTIHQLTELHQQFIAAKKQLLLMSQQFISFNQALSREYSSLNELLSTARNQAEAGLVKEDLAVAGTQAQQRWMADNISKEAQIYLLESKYALESIILNGSWQDSLAFELNLLGLNESIADATGQTLFQQKVSVQNTYQGKSYAQALSESNQALQSLSEHLLAQGEELLQAKLAYAATSKQLQSVLENISDEIDEEIVLSLHHIGESRFILQAMIIGCTLLGLLLSLLIFAMVRNIVLWLQGLHKTALNLADGRLASGFTSHSPAFGGQDMEEINRAVGDLLKRLSEVVIQLRQNTHLVTEISQKVNISATEISRGANDQASSVEETSASIEQMSATVAQNNNNAGITRNIAVQTAQAAKSSGKTVFEMIEAMRHIADKVSIIDDIAYQTNLLALNAAIEASRAGDEGRGFAVVATEVRKLAEKSKLAASDVITLAKQTLQASEEAGKEFANILPNIDKTAELVQEISAASDEQSTGLNEITFAISQLDNVAQYNANAARQLSSMAAELNDSIEQLAELIQFFTIDE